MSCWVISIHSYESAHNRLRSCQVYSHHWPTLHARKAICRNVPAGQATYVAAAIVSQYFNFAVLIIQSFEEVSVLQALSPTQKSPSV